MAQLVTFLELKQRAREAADQVGSTFVSDDELATYLNSSLRKLYNLLVSGYGQEYYYNSEVITISGTSDLYDLPDDFFQLIGVDLVLDQTPNNQSNALTLAPYMFQERNRYVNSYLTTSQFDGTIRMRYRLKGDKLHLIPFPSGFNSLRVHYIPTMELLTSDSDEFDGVNGWEEYAVLDTAIKMVRKEEGDTKDLRADRGDMEDKLISLSSDRDAGNPQRISDVSRENYDSQDGIH